MSHSRAVPSKLAVSSTCPSGRNATRFTSPRCGMSPPTRSPSREYSCVLPLRLAQANVLPVGLNAVDVIHPNADGRVEVEVADDSHKTTWLSSERRSIWVEPGRNTASERCRLGFNTSPTGSRLDRSH